MVQSDLNLASFIQRPPGIESIKEFPVEISVPGPKYSRPASAILSTRGGINEWHSSMFYTGRNHGFGVARRRENFSDKPPQLIRHDYGRSIGGPVIKNRTFFFFSRVPTQKEG